MLHLLRHNNLPYHDNYLDLIDGAINGVDLCRAYNSIPVGGICKVSIDDPHFSCYRSSINTEQLTDKPFEDLSGDDPSPTPSPELRTKHSFNRLPSIVSKQDSPTQCMSSANSIPDLEDID